VAAGTGGARTLDFFQLYRRSAHAREVRRRAKDLRAAIRESESMAEVDECAVDLCSTQHQQWRRRARTQRGTRIVTDRVCQAHHSASALLDES
jgi:hypothetical protein